MKCIGRLLLPFSAALVLVSATGRPVAVASAEEGLQVGAAQVEITPPVGYHHYRGTATGVHNPLYAKALVFQQGDETAAMVVCDLIRITTDLSTEVRTRAAERTGIPYANIFLAATHTHTGPTYRFDLADYLARARAGELRPEDEGSYPARLIEGVTRAVVQAHVALGPSRMESGAAEVHGISFNRRFLMKDGTVRFNPGVRNPDIVRPIGPVDAELSILLFRDEGDGTPRASVSNFALHLDTVGGTEYHADYPYFLAEKLTGRFGPEFLSVFATGACGDINHIDVSPAPSPTTRRIGEVLGEAFLQEIPRLRPPRRVQLGVRSETVFAPLQTFTAQEVEWALDEEETAAQGRDTHGMGTELASRSLDPQAPLYHERPFLQGVRKRKIQTLHRMRRTGEAIAPSVGTLDWTMPLEVQVVRLSDEAAVVAMPGELFVELGLTIKKRSPFENTLVVELANQNINYVPTGEAFRQGDYEVINSRIQPGGGEMMVEAALRMLEELKAELR